MLNLFPIQFLAPLAYFALRVALGFLLLRLGIRLFNKEPSSLFSTSLGGMEMVIGSMFVIGLYTQVAALLTIMLTIPLLMRSHTSLRAFETNRATTFLICIIAFSLFITGAGAFAFDLPI